MWPYLPENPCGCDSCESSNESTTDVGSDNVRYVGPPLVCAGIEPCDTLTTVLQKIDDKICALVTQLNVCCAAEELICFSIFKESLGDEDPIWYTEELPILGNAPFQNGRPVYNIGGVSPGSLYWDGSEWIYASQSLAPILQPLLNSSYYPIGTYSEWGSTGLSGGMNSSTSGPCPTTTTTTTTVYCENYVVQGTATFSSWIGLSCNGTPIGGGLGSGSTATTGCMQADSLQLFGAQIKQNIGPC
jgi:hypothetical protein